MDIKKNLISRIFIPFLLASKIVSSNFRFIGDSLDEIFFSHFPMQISFNSLFTGDRGVFDIKPL